MPVSRGCFIMPKLREFVHNKSKTLFRIASHFWTNSHGSHFNFSFRNQGKERVNPPRHIGLTPKVILLEVIWIVCGFFYVPQRFVRRDLRFIGEKTRKSDDLQMSLQRRHFLLSYFNTLSVEPGFELRTFRSAGGRRSPNWANRAVVKYVIKKQPKLHLTAVTGTEIVLGVYQPVNNTRSWYELRSCLKKWYIECYISFLPEEVL